MSYLKRRKKINAPECELYRGGQKTLLILHLTPGRLAYTVREKYVDNAM